MSVELVHAPFEQVLPSIKDADLAIVDPPYGDTSLDWDRVATEWPPYVEAALKPNGAVWLWGSLRYLMVALPAAEARGWQVSQDIVWEKHNGSGSTADRFRRVHEHVVMLYRGAWGDVYVDPQFSLDATRVRCGGSSGRRTGVRSARGRLRDRGWRAATSAVGDVRAVRTRLRDPSDAEAAGGHAHVDPVRVPAGRAGDRSLLRVGDDVGRCVAVRARRDRNRVRRRVPRESCKTAVGATGRAAVSRPADATPAQEPLPFPDLVQPELPRGATLDDRFRAFHRANPWLLLELERMTAELVDRGRTRVGIAMLFETLRWRWESSAASGRWRLNNSYRSRYARLIVTRHPEWADLFELRALSTA